MINVMYKLTRGKLRESLHKIAEFKIICCKRAQLSFEISTTFYR